MHASVARLLLPAPLIVLGYVGCSPTGFDSADDDGADDTDGFSGDTGAAGDTGNTTDGVTWGLGGDLRLVGGVPSTASAIVLETRGVTCEVGTTIASAVPLDVLPDGARLGWTVTLTLADDATCTWLGPTTVRLAIGALDDDLRPAADRAGIAWEGSFGLYLGGPRGNVWLVGIARPDDGDTDVVPVDTDVGDTDAHTDTDVGDTDTDDTDTDAADTDTSLVGMPPVDAEYALFTLHGIPLSP
jgi:hypothetical protein